MMVSDSILCWFSGQGAFQLPEYFGVLYLNQIILRNRLNNLLNLHILI